MAISLRCFHWSFFSFRGHSGARSLTVHTWSVNWTHSTIFLVQLLTNCSLGTPELNCRFSSELFFITTLHVPKRKHRSEQFLCCCLRICCLAVNVSSGSNVPAFRRHITISCFVSWSYWPYTYTLTQRTWHIVWPLLFRLLGHTNLSTTLR
jgi:hypothetical protein